VRDCPEIVLPILGAEPGRTQCSIPTRGQPKRRRWSQAPPARWRLGLLEFLCQLGTWHLIGIAKDVRPFRNCTSRRVLFYAANSRAWRGRGTSWGSPPFYPGARSSTPLEARAMGASPRLANMPRQPTNRMGGAVSPERSTGEKIARRQVDWGACAPSKNRCSEAPAMLLKIA